MIEITSVEVKGLFGYIDHKVSLRRKQPTLLTGPNGAGKTHLLRLLNAALGLDYEQLYQLPFHTCRIAYSTGRFVEIARRPDEEHPNLGSIRFRLGEPGAAPTSVTIKRSQWTPDSQDLPSYVDRLPDGTYYDGRLARVITREQVESRYWRHRDPLRTPEGEAVRIALTEIRPIFIDTKRLDRNPAERDRLARSYADRDREESSVQRYVYQVRSYVAEARRQSVRASQTADGTFAARAIEAAQKRVKAERLHERYDSVVALSEELARNGLAPSDEPLAFPVKTTSTVLSILNVFLDDWEKRLAPLLRVNARITALRDILDSKLEQSGKSTLMLDDGRLAFRRGSKGRVAVSKLSSGEQHLVALFTMLLFSQDGPSIVLLDEPEISMHAAWKHSFLNDVLRISGLTDQQALIATHSTSIVNGRWDLTEELSFPVIDDAEGNGSGSALEDSDVEIEDGLE